MPEVSEKNIIGMLRERTEESDLEHILKTAIGGYTKKSVLEYLSVLRKQQQATAQTFYQNIQALIEEKEELQANNEALQSKLTRLEAEYKNLSESMVTFSLDNQEFSIQDVNALKNKISALEMEIRKREEANRNLEREIERIENEMSEKEKALEIGQQEIRIQRELLVTEKESSKKDREMVAKLSGIVEEQQREILYVKQTVSESKIAELSVHIKELLASIATQESIIDQKNDQLFEKDKDIHILTEECQVLKKTIENLTDSLDGVKVQNEKLTAIKLQTMSKLDEMYQSNLSLISEKSDLTVEKLLLIRKLDGAYQKLSLRELEERKQESAGEAEKLRDTLRFEGKE